MCVKAHRPPSARGGGTAGVRHDIRKDMVTPPSAGLLEKGSVGYRCPCCVRGQADLLHPASSPTCLHVPCSPGWQHKRELKTSGPHPARHVGGFVRARSPAGSLTLLTGSL